MISLYLLDSQGILSSEVKVDSMGPVPRASTTEPPPRTTGDQVAYWSGAVWTVLNERPAPPPPIQVAPQSVTRRQWLRALLLRGYLDDIQGVIDQIEDQTDRRLAQIDFDGLWDIDRSWSFVVKIGNALGIDLDEFFIYASTL